MKILIIGFQGNFVEWKSYIERYADRTNKKIEIILLQQHHNNIDWNQIDAVLSPGGESGTIDRLLQKTGCKQSLIEYVSKGKPYFGTCSGIIIFSYLFQNNILQLDRNAYGGQFYSGPRQVHTHYKELDYNHSYLFIRAPRISKVDLEHFEIIATTQDKHPVAIKRKNHNQFIMSYHPEFEKKDPLLDIFLNQIKQ